MVYGSVYSVILGNELLKMNLFNLLKSYFNNKINILFS